MSRLASHLLTILVFFGVIVALALWDAGWKFTALPTWFYAYALAAAVVALLGTKLRDLDSAERPGWQRVLLLGFGTLPVVALLSGREVLSNIRNSGGHSGSLPGFLVFWLLWSLGYGAIALAAARKSGKGAQAVRDWF